MKRTLLALVLLASAPFVLASCASTACGPGTAPEVSISGFRCLGAHAAVAAQPSASDLAAARAAGYTTVVNFRTPGEPGYVEERADVEALGMRYVAIPVKGHDVKPSDADVLAPVLADTSGGPVLLHCKTGTRGKIAYAVWLARHGGRSAEQALDDARAMGLSGEPLAAVEKAVR